MREKPAVVSGPASLDCCGPFFPFRLSYHIDASLDPQRRANSHHATGAGLAGVLASVERPDLASERLCPRPATEIPEVAERRHPPLMIS